MKKLLTATALAVMLALNLGAASPAHADAVKHTVTPIGDHVYTYLDENGNKKSTHVYDKDHKHLYSFSYSSDPNPEGDGTGATGYTSDLKDAIEQFLRNGGGDMTLETDFWETPIGKGLVESGKTGSIVPFHNPADSLAYDFEGGGVGGSGGIDLNGGSITEQIKQNAGKKKKDNDDGDDGGGSGDPGTGDDDLEFGGASADMELVNPVPELRQQSSAVGSLMTRRLQSLATSLRPRAAAPRSVATQALRSAAPARTIR